MKKEYEAPMFIKHDPLESVASAYYYYVYYYS